MAEKGKHMRSAAEENVENIAGEEKVVYINIKADAEAGGEEAAEEEFMDYMDEDYDYMYDEEYEEDPFSGGILGALCDKVSKITESIKASWRRTSDEVDEDIARKQRIREARKRENDDVIVISAGLSDDIDGVVARIMDSVPDVGLALFCETDEPELKPDGTMQENGVDCFFISKEEHQRRLDFDEYLFSGEGYGCPNDYIGYLRLMGKRTILLTAAPDDAAYIKYLYPAVTTVFMLPPDKEAVIRRLKAEGITGYEEINRKLKRIAWNLEEADEFDKLVSGVDAEQAACEIASIIYSKRNGSVKRSAELARSIAAFKEYA